MLYVTVWCITMMMCTNACKKLVSLHVCYKRFLSLKQLIARYLTSLNYTTYLHAVRPHFFPNPKNDNCNIQLQAQ